MSGYIFDLEHFFVFYIVGLASATVVNFLRCARTTLDAEFKKNLCPCDYRHQFFIVIMFLIFNCFAQPEPQLYLIRITDLNLHCFVLVILYCFVGVCKTHC